MSGDVICKGSLLAKTFITNITLEWLLLVVRVLVVPEVILSSEGLVALITIEGSFVSVNTFVNDEVVTLTKLTIAELADESFLGTRVEVS